MDKNNIQKQPELQVMICTYGKEGLQRVASASHPRLEGVEYLVCFQNADSEEVTLPEKLGREDFKLIITNTKGLSINRNIALSQATAHLLLISDDDADYTEEGLKTVIDSFRENPESDIISFQYDSTTTRKFYPNESVSLVHPPKGYFISSIEIAMRRDSVQGKIWFNENFGIGAKFPSGEEDVFLRDCLNRGLNGIFIPKTIVRHDGTTTSGRNYMLPSRPQTKGALFLHLHPRQWPLRMIAHAIREIPMWRQGYAPSPFSYCFNWVKGAVSANKAHVFPTPDYSQKYKTNGRIG